MPEPQKIVHVIGTLGQFDASQHLRELARHQVAAGQDVTVIAFNAAGDARRSIETVGARFSFIRQRWDYDPFAARQLAQSLRELDAEVVHLWGTRASQVSILVRRVLPQAKLIATLAKLPQGGNPWWPNKSLNAIDLLVVELESLRMKFIDAGQGEKKVVVIRPAVSHPAEQVHSRRELLLHLDLPSDARLIVLAGPLERWHAVDEAIWSFELIRILHENARLVIVGDGPERGRLERYTRQVSDPVAVRFVSQASLLDDVLAHSEIYWQPGVSEWIPTAMLAALARGLPIVASDIPAHRAVIKHDVNGFLVSPTKRAVWARHNDQLLRSDELRHKFSTANRVMIERNFSMDAMTQAYDRQYREMTSILCSAPS